MAAPSVTYTFANSTIADATQVNQNFSDLINGMSDGTKDLSFDDLQINSFSDDIIPLAAYGSSLGSLTKGVKYLYLGSNDAAAHSVRLSAPTIAADWNFILPANDGENGQFLMTDGAGTATSWRYPFKRTAVTAGYTVAADITHVECDATAGNFNITVPAASAANSGQTVWIRKSDSTFNVVSLITGVTTTLNTVGECVQIHSNGTTWTIVARSGVTTDWTSFSGSWTAVTVNPAIGNGTLNANWRRRGDTAEVTYLITMGSTSTFGTGDWIFAFPTGIAVNTTKLQGSSSTNTLIGFGGLVQGAYHAIVVTYDTTAQFRAAADNAAGRVAAASPEAWGTGQTFMATAVIPVTGWNA